MHLSRRVPRPPPKKLSEYTLAEATGAIELTLTMFEQGEPSADQLGDLADAIDSLSEGDFGVAVALAVAAARTRRTVDKRRPAEKVPIMKEMRAEFERLRKPR